MNPLAADRATHLQRPWRVHELASDFALIDLWEIPIRADPSKGERFHDFFRVFIQRADATSAAPGYRVAPRSVGDLAQLLRLVGFRALLGLRRVLGTLFGWDRDESLAIPGCTETSLRERLSTADRERDRSVEFSSPTTQLPFRSVYVFEDEALLEVSNRTIHALLHLSRVETSERRWSVVMAIYIKSRGRLSNAYMALIKPFRYAVVYPALIKHLMRSWEALRPARM